MRLFLLVMVSSVGLILLIPNTKGGILIPEEISTILSLIYSVLPPIKVGKDSRFGVGFRVGPNIDYQAIVELGPQTNTQPLGQSSSKRAVNTKKNKLKPKNVTPKQTLATDVQGPENVDVAAANLTNVQGFENVGFVAANLTKPKVEEPEYLDSSAANLTGVQEPDKVEPAVAGL